MSRPSEPAGVQALPTLQIAAVAERPPEARWLVESLWAASGVGILGGLPKSLKTWLAAELALAVATGTKALGRFAVGSKGPVLVFAAEDEPSAMRSRFQSLARARGLPFDTLPVFLLDVGALYLDAPDQLARLRCTVATLRPRLLILDPFVRISRGDENSAQEVSHLLGALRALQRDFDLAVLLVHHLRKSPSSSLGQQLRGSGDFAAWYDSALYLVREGGELFLHAEHRSAKAPPPLRIRLQDGDTPHLVVEDLAGTTPDVSRPDPLLAGLLDHLRLSKRPLSTVELRNLLKVRKASLLDALRLLRASGSVQRLESGWALPPQP